MTRRWFVVACCALLSATSALAQGRSSKSDVLTGTWTGTLSRAEESKSIPITLELKFDGKSAVTGTISGLPNPGNVKSGTFDAKTGALKLQLGRSDDPAVLLVFDGTVAKGVASGSVTGDIGKGEFKVTKKE
jgi:hypothetical protein